MDTNERRIFIRVYSRPFVVLENLYSRLFVVLDYAVGSKDKRNLKAFPWGSGFAGGHL
jgi:hypothetical protein